MHTIPNHLRKIAGKTDKLIQTGKYLAFVLRHDPGSIGLTLDKNGWADIDELISKSKRPLTRELIEEVVRTNNKKRYRISEDGSKIRASQGHSIEVDLGLEPKKPPKYLYHGTAERFIDSILSKGIEKRSRQDVHLSLDEKTAEKVGKRHGKPVILRVKAGEMHSQGYVFRLSDNKVWLTGIVPPHFIEKH
jgi:putative RNA 2'-phosphotransferase